MTNLGINLNSQALAGTVTLTVVSTPYDNKLKKKKVNLIEKVKSMTFEERLKEWGLLGQVKHNCRIDLINVKYLNQLFPKHSDV